MKIQKNCIVTFHYELKDADTGVLLESTDSELGEVDSCNTGCGCC